MKILVLFGCVLSALCAAENVVRTNPGGTVILECGSLQPTTKLQWLREDQQLFTTYLKDGIPRYVKEDIKKRFKVKNDKDLEISNVKTEDAGLFKCKVNGNQEESTRLVVVSVSAVPSNNLQAGGSAHLQCDVAGLTSDATVGWVKPNGERTQNKRVDLASVTLSDAGTWKCEFTADGRIMTEILSIAVAETRPKTTKAPFSTRMTEDKILHTCPNCITTSGTPTLAGLSWWMWAAVGGGCLVFILLCVLVLVMYTQMTRRKKRYQKMRKLHLKQYCQCECPKAATKTQPGRRKENASAPPLPPLPVHHH